MVVQEIARYVRSNGIKQSSLSDKTGLTIDCISSTFRGKRKLSIVEYEKICHALDVPYDFFFNKSETSATTVVGELREGGE